MIIDDAPLLLLTAPFAMLLASLSALRQSGLRPVIVERLNVGAAAFNVYIAAIGVALLLNHGPMLGTVSAWQGVGISVQLDPLNAIAFLMIALCGFYLVRIRRTDMVGNRRRTVYLGRLSGTLASLQLFVLTGNLWILIVASILIILAVHDLWVFYRRRRGAPPSLNSA
jgi:NAD(P)H-quinone oxidoreductase subunit 5